MPRKKPTERRAQRAKGRANRPRPWKLLPPASIEKLEQLVEPDRRDGESWAA